MVTQHVSNPVGTAVKTASDKLERLQMCLAYAPNDVKVGKKYDGEDASAPLLL